MPKKLLPRRKQKAQNLSQSKNLELSPNLVKSFNVKFIPQASYRSPLVEAVEKTIWAIVLVYTFILGANFILNSTLEVLKVRQENLLEVLGRSSDLETILQDLDYYSKVYEKTIAVRKEVALPTETLMNSIPLQVQFNEVSYSESVFTFSLLAEKAVDFSRVIINFLDIEEVESITINSVEYDSETNLFETNFEIKIK
ncbi:hypothetical protein ACFL13_02695 [Patescibacteria group bacterium]